MPVFNKLIYDGTEYTLGGGSNIGEPLNLTVTREGLDVTITWEDNEIGTIPPTSFAKSELVRKVGSAPTSPSDGTLVVTETVKDTYKVSGYTDSGLTDGTTYYYRVFSYSDLGGISYCDAVSVTVSNPRQPGVNTKVYYKINDNDTNTTIYDLSGNGVDQTWSGTASYTTDATYGRVAVFDGNTYTEASSIVNFGGELTLIALFKLNSTSDNRTIFSECASASRRPVGINIDGGYTKALFATSSDGQVLNSTTSLSTGQWYMIAMSRANDGTTKLYINGTIDATGTAANSPTYESGANLRLSSWRDGYYKINGQIKLCIGEDRTWTDQEIADLATEYGFTVS